MQTAVRCTFGIALEQSVNIGSAKRAVRLARVDRLRKRVDTCRVRGN